jgi:hypothetical protein
MCVKSKTNGFSLAEMSPKKFKDIDRQIYFGKVFTLSDRVLPTYKS